MLEAWKSLKIILKIHASLVVFHMIRGWQPSARLQDKVGTSQRDSNGASATHLSCSPAVHWVSFALALTKMGIDDVQQSNPTLCPNLISQPRLISQPLGIYTILFCTSLEGQLWLGATNPAPQIPCRPLTRLWVFQLRKGYEALALMSGWKWSGTLFQKHQLFYIMNKNKKKNNGNKKNTHPSQKKTIAEAGSSLNFSNIDAWVRIYSVSTISMWLHLHLTKFYKLMSSYLETI